MQLAQDIQVVICKVGNEEYGLPIGKVQEINRILEITKLPNTLSFVEGIINLRGRVLPVIDLRKRLGLAAGNYNDDTRIMVTDIAGQTAGLIVDAVNEVVTLPGNRIELPPASFVLDSGFIQGIGKWENRLIILIDVDRVMSDTEFSQLKQSISA